MIQSPKGVDSKNWPMLRARAVAIAVGLVFVAVTFRASMVAMGAAPEPRRGVSSAVKAERRAQIVDRKGEILADSLSFDSLSANPRALWDAEEVADGLLTVFPDMDRARLLEKLADQRRGFVWVRRKVRPRERQAVYALGLEGLSFAERRSVSIHRVQWLAIYWGIPILTWPVSKAWSFITIRDCLKAASLCA